MRQLPVHARIYLIVCYVLGALALGWLLFSFNGSLTLTDWLMAAGLAIGASACQVLVVERRTTAGQRSDHLTLTPLFAAVLLLPRPLLALVVVLTFVPEWYLRRRSWFGQLFNVAVYLVAAALARLSLFALTGQYRLEGTAELLSWQAIAVAPPLLIFEATQTFMLALVLKLARGQSFRTSGLFTRDSLLLEGALLCMGLGFATSWVVDPFYGLLSAIPLVLIFQALHVPNLIEQATTDSKTGLANMRYFDEAFARLLERAQRSSQPLSLLMCDLDYLRNINNTYGHQAGDVVLAGIANVIRRNVREVDVAARFGGEEFVIVLSDTDGERARFVAEAIRGEIEQARFDVGHQDGPIGATISIGAASFPWDGESTEQLTRQADLAVYQAKRDGRNRVAVAGSESRALAAEWAREHLVSSGNTDQAAPDRRRPRWESISRFTGGSADTGVRPSSVVRQSRLATPTLPTGPAGPARSETPGRVLAFVVAVVATGLLSLLHGLPVESVPWESLALFVALTVLAEQFAVNNTGAGRISVSTVTILSTSFLYHEIGVLAATIAAVLSMAVKARGFSHRMLFNFGAVLLAAESGHLAFDALSGGITGQNALASLILPAIVAGLTYHVVNQILLCTVRGLSEQRRPWQIWYAEYRWLWPHYAVLGALALVVALGYQVFGPLGVVALMAPVGMMHLAIKQYLEHTKGYVNELQQMNERLSDAYEGTLQALSQALDTRDGETEAHSQRVCRYTRLIAQQLYLPEAEIQEILRGALLHDVGKIGVPDAILRKSGRLTEEEWGQMRKHPEIGYSMIANIPFLAGAAQVVLHHHEAYNGAGYPSGLAGDDIPLGARIFAVADAFDAMTSDRPYRKALPLRAAYTEIERCGGIQFDPKIVEAFLAIPADELMEGTEETGLPAITLDELVGRQVPVLAS